MTEPASPNLSPTPQQPESGPSEQELEAILAHSTHWVSALGQGIRLAGQTAAIGVPFSLAFGLVSGLVGYRVLQAGIAAKDAPPATIDLYGQITLAIGALAAVYAVIQFSKRTRVTRASWWPALLAAPFLLLAGAFALIESGQMRQLAPVVLSLFGMSWALLWQSFGGAAVAVAWLIAGKRAFDGESIGFGEVLEKVRERTLDVAGPHGARVHAVTIGIQLLLPGIFYALQLAFTDMVAVFDPERGALSRSGTLTYNLRGKLFRMMFVWYLLGTLVTLGVALPIEGATTGSAALEKFQELMLDPSSPSQATYVIQEVLWALFSWVLTLSLMVLYLEREGKMQARAALKKLRAASTSKATSGPG
ncbi:MAG: hypothetical protein ABMB14_09280 [Myxococcota bacterium]